MGSARWGHSLSKAADVAHEFKDRWIRKGTLASDAFRVISEATLQPCAAAVSRDDACKLICSYNWQDSKESRKKYVRTKNPLIRVPGTHSSLPGIHLITDRLTNTTRIRTDLAACLSTLKTATR